MKNVYVVSAARTAVGKAKRGSLAHVRPDDMAGAVIKDAIGRASINPGDVQDVVLGCAMPETVQGMNVARIAATIAEVPYTVPAMTINRFCSSGLEAMAIAAAKIETGLFDVAVGGGTESMSMVSMTGAQPSPNPGLMEDHPELYISMGNAGDNVARDFGFSREDVDAWALSSHEKAIAAQDGGKFSDQITPLTVSNGAAPKTFAADEGPRRGTSMEALGGLRPAFAVSPKLGVCTAGNSSQTSDGAAACVLMSDKAVKERGAKPLARFVSYSVAADNPKYLGPAQLVAIPAALEMAGVKIADVGLFEINEAFASVALLVTRELKIDPEKVNVNGGAIALGHPLGCTGCKLTVQILDEMRRRGEKYGVVTMCIGGGQGAAGVFELCE